MQDRGRNTIVALSSGKLPSGVAIIRVSGDDTGDVVSAVTGSLPEPRIATLRDMKAPDGQMLDRGLVLLFPRPNSFTGEDVAEFHVHGGRAVVEAVLSAICSLDGCRMAEPGEFSRRALLNGKIDLTGAEAIADLIGADTSAQHRFALSNARGEQNSIYQAWRDRMIRIRAEIEADLDFADEGDVPDDVARAIEDDIRRLSYDMRSHMALYRKAEIIQDGFRVVLVGAPNAGKSSLLNALARRDVAIVSEEAGTTRDAIDVALDLGGYKVIITDTAGLRNVAGVAEMKGITRTMERAGEADLILWLSDQGFGTTVPIDHPHIIKVATKIDIAASLEIVSVSSVTGDGIERLLEKLSAAAKARAPQVDETIPWKLRHVGLIREACERLENLAGRTDVGLELISEEIRLASMALGKISGHIDVEHLLDEIFARFCIGK